MAVLVPPLSVRRPAIARLLPVLPTVSLGHVWIAAAICATGFASSLLALEAIDYWWSIKIGELIWQAGGLLDGDPLVHTPVREPLVDGQWLAKLILFGVHRLGGVELALALRTAIALAVAGLLLKECLSLGAGVRVASALVAVAGPLALSGMAVRPQLLALVPFMLVARSAARPPRTLLGALTTAAVVVFWANVHGSFVLAYVLFGASIADAAWARWRGASPRPIGPLLRVAALAAIAPLANPYGPGLLGYVADVVLFNGLGTSVGVVGTEWSAPRIWTLPGGAFYGSALLVAGLVAVGRRPTFREALLLAAFAVLAAQAVRHVHWWVLVATPYLGRALAARRSAVGSAPPVGSPTLNALMVGAFGLVLALTLPWWRTSVPLAERHRYVLDPATPVGVAEYLAEHQPPGALFNFVDWGGYLEWRLGPGRPVFIDGRFEIHPPAVWRDYQAISQGHDSWEEVLAAYGVTQLALHPAAQPGLAAVARQSPRWRLAYEDEQALVFERQAGT